MYKRRNALNEQHQQQLIAIAQATIRHGLDHGRPLSVQIGDYDAELEKEFASFVTLKISGELRGCIGSLQAYRPLVLDIAENAYRAAFNDSRFSPMSQSEYEKLQYHISVLSTPEPMQVNSEQDLLSQLRVGIDGLILTLGNRRATFLPSVWEQLPDKSDFLNHLKAKAGLTLDYWNESIELERYTVESFGD
ncbi:AMMECR1 domain-containing protein [Oleiphilus sp. HI0081]|nr:AMMECR1 domain-containing protein [Oleiphilus sp. HI0072]KZZ08160.1 AMMECR1 domain-containing protein [Oleiphilus sp. HI0078]KZZ19048.1 AMMECR1 domain-containing protein [Oleiphilus sp. HI0081]KZZ79935.1 AMMECR1 domain-containing protein [Oleiphilus sp. HI0132]